MKDILKFVSANKARFLPIGILLFLAIATLLTLTLTKKNTELRSKAATDNGQLTFANLSATSVAPGGTFTVAVNMNGGGQNVIGADVLVCFDRNKLTLLPATNNPPGIVKNIVTTVYKTYAPVDANGDFDATKVISNANNNVTCSTGNGIVEFGFVTFDWSANTLTSPTTALSPAATLAFRVNSGVSGSTILSFVNNGLAATTDSNIVVNPTSGDPEDILQDTAYAGNMATINITGTASPTPTATPRPSATPSTTPRPSATPTATPRPSVTPSPTPAPSPIITASATPSPSSGTCTVRTCQDYGGIITGRIDIQDIALIAGRFGIDNTSVNYSVIYDLNCDGKINIFDIAPQAGHFNLTCP